MINNWDRSIESLLEKYCSEAVVREKLHRAAYYTYKRKLTWFQLPLICISAVNGAMQFLSKSYPKYENAIITSTGSTSIIVAVLTSVMSFLKLGEGAANHQKSQLEWLNFFNAIRAQLVLKPELRMDGLEFLADVKNRYLALFEFSPIPSKHNIARVKRAIKNGHHDKSFHVPMYMNGLAGVETYEESFEDNSIDHLEHLEHQG